MHHDIWVLVEESNTKSYVPLLHSNLTYWDIVCELQALITLFLGEIQA